MANDLMAYATSTFEGLGDSIAVSDIFTYVVDLLGEVWVLVALAIAIPLTFVIIRKVISILR